MMFTRILYFTLIMLCGINFNVFAQESNENQPKEKVFLLLQCENTKQMVKNRLDNINYKLTEFDKWNSYKNEAFYFVAFGTNWEEVEETCYAHPAYIETSTYTTSVPYTSKMECLEGIYGKGKQEFFDSWGDYFRGDLSNSYVQSKNLCNIKARYLYAASKARRMERSGRRNCELSRKHFLNLITDSGYSKRAVDKEWQMLRCKEISVEVFEQKTGLYVKELQETLAEDII